MRALALLAVFLVAISAAAACGGSASTSTTPDGGSLDAAPVDGGSGDASVDASLVPDGVTKIVVTEKGGGPLPTPPDGSTCQPANAAYTIVLPARELSWSVCEWGDGGPYFVRTGQKTLSAAEYATIDAAVHALRRTTKTQCGADKPTEQITFTTPSGDVTYYDDFYFCDANDPKPYVSGIDEVLSAIDQYAR